MECRREESLKRCGLPPPKEGVAGNGVFCRRSSSFWFFATSRTPGPGVGGKGPWNHCCMAQAAGFDPTSDVDFAMGSLGGQ